MASVRPEEPQAGRDTEAPGTETPELIRPSTPSHGQVGRTLALGLVGPSAVQEVLKGPIRDGIIQVGGPGLVREVPLLRVQMRKQVPIRGAETDGPVRKPGLQ